jgi:hypothetical protein
MSALEGRVGVKFITNEPYSGNVAMMGKKKQELTPTG